MKAIQKSIVNEINEKNEENNRDKIITNDNIRDHNKKIFSDELPTLKSINKCINIIKITS